MEKMYPVSFRDVNIRDGFWKDRIRLNEDVTVYSVMDRFKDTGRFEAFTFNWKEGSDAPKPHFFWDSDVFKWMESVCYVLSVKEDEVLRNELEQLIDLIDKNRCPDGYFNIYHTVVAPELRFRNRDNHELYCLGHLIEAAVAYYYMSGNDRLINICDDYIDLVIKVFCEEKSAGFVTPGHEEIELALFKLYRVKRDKKYLDLAMFFINERGKTEEKNPDWYNSSYNQCHKPLRKLRKATGHCVRAGYLYSAMADAVRETEDIELNEACKALFSDIINTKMYISGGVGSSHHGEAYTVPYDLPNATAYSETCAAISLMMFADRMKDIDFNSKYADIVEREIYNGIISGVSLDGKAFFYENPLEINLSDRNRHTSVNNANEHFPITERKEVFGCSCCPPNITRFFASIGDHIFSVRGNSPVIHQFMNCSTEIDGVGIDVATVYPRDGKVTVSVTGGKGRDIYIRIPWWCREFTVSEAYDTENGYMKLFVDSDSYKADIDFNMKAELYVSSALVPANAGKLAVMYGPVLYCIERNDIDVSPSAVEIDVNSEIAAEYSEFFGANVLYANAFINENTDSLYMPLGAVKKKKMKVKLIPYFGFANRGESDMAVWLNYSK